MTTIGDQLALDGIDANLSAATAPHRVTYRDHAEAALAELCRQRREFSAEDVRVLIPEGVEPHSHNVLPSLIRLWASRGAIQHAGWVATSRPSRHGSVNRLWRGTGTDA